MYACSNTCLLTHAKLTKHKTHEHMHAPALQAAHTQSSQNITHEHMHAPAIQAAERGVLQKSEVPPGAGKGVAAPPVAAAAAAAADDDGFHPTERGRVSDGVKLAFGWGLEEVCCKK